MSARRRVENYYYPLLDNFDRCPFFILGPDYSGLRSAKYIGVTRVDADALPDVVTFSGQILFNLPGGGLSAPVPFATIEEPKGMTLADLDLDGNLDVIVARNFISGGQIRAEVRFFFKMKAEKKEEEAETIALLIEREQEARDEGRFFFADVENPPDLNGLRPRQLVSYSLPSKTATESGWQKVRFAVRTTHKTRSFRFALAGYEFDGHLLMDDLTLRLLD